MALNEPMVQKNYIRETKGRKKSCVEKIFQK